MTIRRYSIHTRAMRVVRRSLSKSRNKRRG